MGSLVNHIRQMVDSMTLGATRGQMKGLGKRGIIELEESPHVGVESESTFNLRVHRVVNGWVVNTTIEANGSYESETHVCGTNDNVVEKITELVAMYKLNA